HGPGPAPLFPVPAGARRGHVRGSACTGSALMRAAIIQHVPFAGLGRIRPWLDRRGIEAVRCRPYAGDAMPDLETFDLLIALGGPLSVHDTERHLWLLEEKQLIGEAL